MKKEQEVKRMTLRLPIDLHRWLFNHSHKLKQSMHETILDLVRCGALTDLVKKEDKKYGKKKLKTPLKEIIT